MAAREGGFEHLVQRLRDERTEAAERARITDELTAAGVSVIERPGWTDAATDLGVLKDADGEPLDVEAHTTCPGHGAYIQAEWASGDEETDDDTGEGG